MHSVAQGGTPYSWSKLSLLASFGQRLRRLRRDAGLTQCDLAQRLGVDRRSLQRYELGQMFPAPETLVALVQALGLRFEDLFMLVPPMPRDRPARGEASKPRTGREDES